MNAFTRLAAVTCLAGAMLAAAPTAAGSGPAPARIVIDCARTGLPTQREVGELLGQHNFAQVYASRTALVAEARRACRREPGQAGRVAIETPSARFAPFAPAPQERHLGDARRRGH